MVFGDGSIITKQLLEDLRERKGNSIELSNDFYWVIPDPKQLYNPYEEPKDILSGQLAFDVENLRQSYQDKSMVNQYLAKLGHVLIALSDE